MTRLVVLKAAVWMLLAAPFVYLSSQIYFELQAPGEVLGADPGEAVVHFLGEWALISLLVAFSVSPLRRLCLAGELTKENLGLLFARSRRLFGLFAFFYVTLHLFAYVFFFLELSLKQFLQDLVERSYITAGMGAFVILLAMAFTSTKGWQLRLKHRWAALHKLVYAAVGLAIIHLWWLTRDDFTEVVLYAAWFGLLLLFRLRVPARLHGST